MSIRVMTTVWDNFPGSGSELLVMLALADWCNDDGGSVHPSIATVARKVRTSESQARRLIHGLIEKGWIEVTGNEFGGAPGSSRRYRVNVQKIASAEKVFETGSASARGGVNATPRTDACDGSRGCAPTGSTGASQSTTLSINDPPVSSAADKPAKPKAPKPADPPPLTIDDIVAEGVDRQHAADWFIVRKAKKAPLTQTAWDGVKSEAAKAGITPAIAVQVCAKESWQGFKAIWYKNLQNNKQGNNHGNSNSGRRESEAERVERINREHDEREHASGVF